MKKIILFILALFAIFNTTFANQQQLGDGVLCPPELQLHQNLRAPNPGEPYIRDGKYDYYTNAVVTEARILQKHLNRLGFNAGKIDGIIGPNTRAAIKRMQTFLGTKPDGLVGPNTRYLINHSCNSQSENYTGNGQLGDGALCPPNLIMHQKLRAPNYGEPYIRDGVYDWYTGEKVREAYLLQTHLNRLGFNAGKIDGIIGPNTRAAIKRMQTFLGTKPDGLVGPITINLINHSCQASNSGQENIEYDFGGGTNNNTNNTGGQDSGYENLSGGYQDTPNNSTIDWESGLPNWAKGKCQENDSCCRDSLTAIINKNIVALENGETCPTGFSRQQLDCETSLSWCEMGSEDLNPKCGISYFTCDNGIPIEDEDKFGKIRWKCKKASSVKNCEKEIKTNDYFDFLNYNPTNKEITFDKNNDNKDFDPNKYTLKVINVNNNLVYIPTNNYELNGKKHLTFNYNLPAGIYKIKLVENSSGTIVLEKTLNIENPNSNNSGSSNSGSSSSDPNSSNSSSTPVVKTIINEIALDHSHDTLDKIGIALDLTDDFDPTKHKLYLNGFRYNIEAITTNAGKKYLLSIKPSYLINGQNSFLIKDENNYIISETYYFTYNKNDYLYSINDFENAVNHEKVFTSSSKVGMENIVNFTKGGILYVDLSDDDRGVKILIDGEEKPANQNITIVEGQKLQLFYGSNKSLNTKTIKIKFTPGQEV